MIPAKKNNIIHWFFHRYILRLINSNFHTFNYNTIPIEKEKSVLLLANHFSWWDGFMLYYLNNKLLKKRFHIMILEDTVRKVFFLKYMGAFSISKNSKDMISSLNYAAELLNDPNNLVLIFPQGKLYSNFTDEVIFEKGIMKVAGKIKDRAQVIFAATFIENFQHKKPGITVYVDNCPCDAVNTLEDLAAAYAKHYQHAKQQQTQISI